MLHIFPPPIQALARQIEEYFAETTKSEEKDKHKEEIADLQRENEDLRRRIQVILSPMLFLFRGNICGRGWRDLGSEPVHIFSVKFYFYVWRGLKGDLFE